MEERREIIERIQGLMAGDDTGAEAILEAERLARAKLFDLLRQNIEIHKPSRAASIAATKLDELEMWLERAAIESQERLSDGGGAR